jgi:hypothetical protein
MIELPQWSLKEAIALLDIDKLEIINLAVILGGIGTDRNAVIHYSHWRTMVNVKDHPMPYSSMVWALAESIHAQAKMEFLINHREYQHDAPVGWDKIEWRDINNA